VAHHSPDRTGKTLLAVSRIGGAAGRYWRHRHGPRLAALWKRMGRTWIGASVADQLIRLDRSKDGFIAEAWNAKSLVSPADSYRRFWFEGDNDSCRLSRALRRLVDR
jgi:hypothetical protein